MCVTGGRVGSRCMSRGWRRTVCVLKSLLFFFFKQKTAYEITYGDWSSDGVLFRSVPELLARDAHAELIAARLADLTGEAQRSEERRVGKECRSRWSPYP